MDTEYVERDTNTCYPRKNGLKMQGSNFELTYMDTERAKQINRYPPT